MAVLSAAALGALLGAAMPMRKRKTSYLRGTSLVRRARARRAATRFRPRARRRLTKRQWQARARREVANPRNFSTSKTTESVLPGGNGFFNLVLQQRVKVVPLITINRGTDINQRLRDACILSGVKIDATFLNRESYRLFLNWAVIHPKTDENVTETEADFFRDYTNERSWNAGDAGKTGLSWNNASINTDKFTVLKRGKFLLAPGSQTGAVTQGFYNLKDCEKDVSIWTKISRTITFKDISGGQAPIEQLYFVFWSANSGAAAGNNIGDVGMGVRVKAVCYFREPRSG